MKREAMKRSLGILWREKEKMNTRSDYQRPEVWKRAQKQLLIDSILRDYDIPKMYVKKETEGQFDYEVIDGQQRLVAIWEFFDGGFTLPRDSEPIRDLEIASKGFIDLDTSLRDHFDNYEIDFVVITDAVKTEKKDEVGELFLRLQNGTPLNPQEKRNAMPGKMRDFVKEIVKHNFFESCSFSNIRYAHDQVAAQLVCLELAGEPVNIKASDAQSGDLNRMYRDERNFEIGGATATKVKQTLNYLYEAFPNRRTPELLRSNIIITLYCFASHLIKYYDYQGTQKKLKEWFIEFEKKRKENDALDYEDKKRDGALTGYSAASGSGSDTQANIKTRLNLVLERFFLTHPDILQKDKNRSFSHEQKLAIYRRDEAKCQVKIECDGTQTLEWDEWEADHIAPHAKGGQTTVANGQVACKACNRAKSDKL